MFDFAIRNAFNTRFAATFMAVCLFASLVVFTGCEEQAKGPPKYADIRGPETEKLHEELGRAFIDALVNEDFETAYNMIDGAVRAGMTLEQFTSDQQLFFDAYGQPLEIDSLKVGGRETKFYPDEVSMDRHSEQIEAKIIPKPDENGIARDIYTLWLNGSWDYGKPYIAKYEYGETADDYFRNSTPVIDDIDTSFDKPSESTESGESAEPAEGE